MVTPPTNWKSLAQVIAYAEAKAKADGIQYTVFCINGAQHYDICQKGKLPPDYTKIGKLIIHKDHRRQYSEVFTTRVQT